jgi:ectoine hydroxylase-related dioxygenase (phytanoyl-CoA dioxygenase family)
MTLLRIDCRSLSECSSTEDIAKSEPIRLAYECFVRNGYALLDHVLSVPDVSALRGEFHARYEKYLQDREYGETMEVGNKRFLVPVELSGGFAEAQVWANRYVIAVVRELLGEDAVLDNFGAVVSLGGSEKQHSHRDASLLFESRISSILPAYAMTVVLPLIDMNERQGTTAIWPGSHRWTEFQDKEPALVPEIPAGSAFMWDYRLYHFGTPNQTSVPRPMIYGAYARSWYRDAANFRKETQRRLWLPDGFVAALPKDQRRLFARVE